jgi:hypothetical protein
LEKKEELLRDEEHFRDIIEKICEALSKIDNAKSKSATLKQNENQNPKEIREPLAVSIGANADLWLALGALVTAQESKKVDGKTIGLTETWRATVWDDLEESNEDVARHDNVQMYESPQPQGERWVGSWPLGSGAFGNTRLFVQQDGNGQICNRVVVKDCDCENQGDWDDKEWFWLKDHRNQDIPVEVKTMSDLRGRSGAEFIVRILSWRIARERRLYRLYLEV